MPIKRRMAGNPEGDVSVIAIQQRPLEKALESLHAMGKSVKQATGGYACQCPAHDDNRPSCHISEGDDGKLLAYCQAGCSFEQIRDALGLDKADVYMENGSHKNNGYVASYRYHDESGRLLYTVHRTADKRFFPQLPDGRYGYNGSDRVLYRLTDVIKSTGRVFVVEGEKDVDRLHGLGLTATTNPGGSNAWRKQYADSLKDRDVVILHDNDPAGEKWCRAVELSLRNTAKNVKVLDLPGLSVGGDVSDWLNNGGDKEQLLKMANKRDRQIKRRSLSAIQPKEVEWLWPEILPVGMLATLVSQEGVGKSTLASYIASTISQGRAWPNGGNAPKGDVILFSHEEDSAIVIAPRLIANDADRNRIHLAEGIETASGDDCEFDLERDIVELDAWVDELPETRLIIFDPITSYVNCNENSNSEVRKALKPLIDFASRRKIAVLGLSHLNKKIDAGMINRTIGSRAWSAVPRMSWGVRTEQVEDEDGHKSDTENRFMLNIKCNIGPRPRGLKFSIGDGGCVTFDTERLDMSMDDQGGVKISRLNEAVTWLTERLAQGSVLSQTIFDEGQKRGFYQKLLHRAKDELKIKPRKEQFGGRWSWSLPNA